MAVTKVINSESKAYKPVLTDMLVLDAVPTVNSLNGVTSDAVARAIAGASGEVPQVTESDNGKVLTAVYDEGGAAVEWAEAQGGGGASYTAGEGITIDENNQISVDTTVSTASGSIDVGGDSPITITFTPTLIPTRTTDLISTQQIEEVSTGGLTWLVASYPSTLTEPLDLGAATATVVLPAPAETITPAFSGVEAFYGKADIATYASDALGSQIKFNRVINPALAPTTALVGGNFDMFGANDPTYSDRASYVYLIIKSYDPNIKSALKDWMATWRVIEWPTEVSQTVAIPSVDQEFNGSSTNAQSGTAVASAISSIRQVPYSFNADTGKVLTVTGQGSYAWQTAQGGGGASYTAGQGIAIDGNNAISVDASASDFTFGQRSTLSKWSNNYNFILAYYTDSSVICTKDSYINLARETGNVHLVCDNTGMVAGNYAVCNANYAFSNWRLTSDVKIEISKTASDWTFTGNTFNIGDGLCYITIAGTTGSTVTPNGEIPVEVSVFDTAQFDVITNPNQLSLKNSIPTVDQSYNASSTHAQSGTAVAQALASAGGGITWTKITNMTTTSYSLAANFSYSIPSGKTAVQVTLMLRLSEFSGTWSTIPKELTVELKLNDGYGSYYLPVGSITNPNDWLGGQPGTVWMLSGTVVVPSDWYQSIDGIQLEIPASGGSLPANYTKALFVGIA